MGLAAGNSNTVIVAILDPSGCDRATSEPRQTFLVADCFNNSNPWEIALVKLSVEDQRILSLSSLDKLDALDHILEATKEKRDICRQKQWKYTWKGETIILRDVADKILAWVDKFKAIGDVAVNFDPTHAALPWAGFRFLLRVSSLLCRFLI